MTALTSAKHGPGVAEKRLKLWAVPTIVVALGACGMTIALVAGAANEAVATALVATTVTTAASGYLVARGIRKQRAHAAQIMVVLVVAVVAAVSVLPPIAIIFPGRAQVSGELRSVGDTLAIPNGVQGSVRLLISVVPTRGVGVVRVELAGAHRKVAVAVHRSDRATLGPGVPGPTFRGASSVYAAATIPESAQQLTLVSLRPQVAGPVLVQIYRVRLPHGMLVTLYLIALLLAVAIEWRLGPGTGIAFGAAAMLLYGMNLRAAATPTSSLQPALIGILPSAFLGGVLSLLLLRLVRRFLGRRNRRS